MIYFEDIALNKITKSIDYYVSKEELINFATQWDPQPYHTSDEGAQAYGMELFGSSTHSYTILTKLQTELKGEKPAIIAGLGIESWRTPNPLKPNSFVHSESYVESKRESNSKPHLGIITSVSKLIDNKGNIILEYKSNGLAIKSPNP